MTEEQFIKELKTSVTRINELLKNPIAQTLSIRFEGVYTYPYWVKNEPFSVEISKTIKL